MRLRFPAPPGSALIAGAGLLSALLAAGRGDHAPAAGGGPARLVLLEPTVDLGALDPGVQRELSLPWRRAGVGPLRVLAVRTGCGCVVAQGQVGVLAACARGMLRLRLRAPRRRGPFVHHVRVLTDAAPPHAVVVCRVAGYVVTPLALCPDLVDLGRRTPAARVERVVELRSRTPLAADLTFAWAGVTGSVAVEPAARRDLPGALLRLSLCVPGAEGPFHGELAVCAGRRLLGVLRVRGTVQPRRP